MRSFSAVIERDPDTGQLVGFVPGFPGAHSQGLTLDELNANLKGVSTDAHPAPPSKIRDHALRKFQNELLPDRASVLAQRCQ